MAWLTRATTRRSTTPTFILRIVPVALDARILSKALDHPSHRNTADVYVDSITVLDMRSGQTIISGDLVLGKMYTCTHGASPAPPGPPDPPGPHNAECPCTDQQETETPTSTARVPPHVSSLSQGRAAPAVYDGQVGATGHRRHNSELLHYNKPLTPSASYGHRHVRRHSTLSPRLDVRNGPKRTIHNTRRPITGKLDDAPAGNVATGPCLAQLPLRPDPIPPPAEMLVAHDEARRKSWDALGHEFAALPPDTHFLVDDSGGPSAPSAHALVGILVANMLRFRVPRSRPLRWTFIPASLLLRAVLPRFGPRVHRDTHLLHTTLCHPPAGSMLSELSTSAETTALAKPPAQYPSIRKQCICSPGGVLYCPSLRDQQHSAFQAEHLGRAFWGFLRLVGDIPEHEKYPSSPSRTHRLADISTTTPHPTSSSRQPPTWCSPCGGERIAFPPLPPGGARSPGAWLELASPLASWLPMADRTTSEEDTRCVVLTRSDHTPGSFDPAVLRLHRVATVLLTWVVLHNRGFSVPFALLRTWFAVHTACHPVPAGCVFQPRMAPAVVHVLQGMAPAVPMFGALVSHVYTSGQDSLQHGQRPLHTATAHGMDGHRVAVCSDAALGYYHYRHCLLWTSTTTTRASARAADLSPCPRCCLHRELALVHTTLQETTEFQLARFRDVPLALPRSRAVEPSAACAARVVHVATLIAAQEARIAAGGVTIALETVCGAVAEFVRDIHAAAESSGVACEHLHDSTHVVDVLKALEWCLVWRGYGRITTATTSGGTEERMFSPPHARMQSSTNTTTVGTHNGGTDTRPLPGVHQAKTRQDGPRCLRWCFSN
jgi:hypothetical protein